MLSYGAEVLKVASYANSCRFPYHSGLFFLREGPSSVEAVRRLGIRPDVVCFDAHGLLHPRGAGMATICGAVLDLPSIGIAKSALIGSEVKLKDKISKVVHEGVTLGFVTNFGTKRYWSPGYCVTIPFLLDFIERHGEISLRMMSRVHEIASSRKEA